MLKFTLKFAKGLKSVLSDLSAYPGLGFLKKPAVAIGNSIARYDSAVERSERVKQQIAISKRKAGNLTEAVKPKGKSGKGEADEPAPGQQAAAQESAAPEKPARSPAGPAPGKASGAPPEVHGTLMLDAFMQGANVPPDVREQWLQAAAHPPQGSDTPGPRAYSGTLMMGSGHTLTANQATSDHGNQASPPPQSPAHESAIGPQPATSEIVEAEPHGGSPEPQAHLAYGGGVADLPYAQESARLPPTASEPAWRQPEPAAPARWSEPARVERVAQAAEAAAVAAYVPPPRPAEAVRESMSGPAREAADEERWAEGATTSALAANVEEDQPALIPLAQRQQQLARLEYVCQLLRELRQPLCPANGALAILPMPSILAGSRELVELQKSVKADLATIQNELKLRFPVTALAVGLEEDPGFEELVRRVGAERARSQRFGHRFDVRSVPTPGQLAALTMRISGVFEDWVYAIYRERGAIARRGNSHLFGLLCKVRTLLQERLTRVLCGGFGHDPEQATREEPIAFSGCYFAATGRSEDRRAFVAGVFDKLNEEQDNVEWTGEALRDDRRFRRAGWYALGLIALTGVAVAIRAIITRL